MNKVNSTSKSVIQLFIQPVDGNPVSYKLDLKQVSKVVMLLGFAFLILFWGTLFFFRELEKNRELQEAFLETELKLQLKTLSEPSMLPPNRQLGYSVQLEPDSNLNLYNPSESSKNPSDQKESWMALTSTPISARLGSLSSECQIDNCSVKLELLPAGNGISQGELLLVLETEVPRIGSRSVTTQQRKQFIFYPGYISKDEFTNSELSQFERRPFKFAKTLSASVNFKITKLLRPLALNIYLFDYRKNLIHHERKVIELEESNAN